MTIYKASQARKLVEMARNGKTPKKPKPLSPCEKTLGNIMDEIKKRAEKGEDRMTISFSRCPDLIQLGYWHVFDTDMNISVQDYVDSRLKENGYDVKRHNMRKDSNDRYVEIRW